MRYHDEEDDEKWTYGIVFLLLSYIFLHMMTNTHAYEERRMWSCGPVVDDEDDEIWTYGVVVVVLYIYARPHEPLDH